MGNDIVNSEIQTMSENKTEKPVRNAGEPAGRHHKRVEERRERQAEALRANLKRRKVQVRKQRTPADKDQ